MVVSPGRKPLRRTRNNTVPPPPTDGAAAVIADQHDDDDDGHHRGCGDSKIWTQLAHSIAHVFAPRHRQNHTKRIHHPPLVTKPRRHLLHGCTTLQEHLAKIQATLDAVQGLHGREGLARLGFTYRWIPCEACGGEDATDTDAAAAAAQSTTCHHCAQRLVYQEADVKPTRITEHNRKDYIADGKMYEAVCRLAQEVAQECLAEVGDLEWKTVEDSTDDQRPPIRILVSRRHADKDITAQSPNRLLVICTGRGKVRAGIFSRFALLCTGLEIGTAFHSVQSATSADYDTIALIDPNAHGEAQGFVTFRKSLAYLRQQHDDDSTIDLLLHSASGGHYARTLLEDDTTTTNNCPFRRVVFTDSTHNIQWMKHRPCLAAALQDPTRVLYVRSSSSTPFPSAGTPAPTDTMWRHRFGTIPTVWAGTQHHALTNWSAHTVIWDFFHRNDEEREDTTQDGSTDAATG